MVETKRLITREMCEMDERLLKNPLIESWVGLSRKPLLDFTWYFLYAKAVLTSFPVCRKQYRPLTWESTNKDEMFPQNPNNKAECYVSIFVPMPFPVWVKRSQSRTARICRKVAVECEYSKRGQSFGKPLLDFNSCRRSVLNGTVIYQYWFSVFHCFFEILKQIVN